MNIIFNELRQQRVKYVHTTSKIKLIHAIFYHILFLLVIYFNWNYFAMCSNTIRRAWVDLLSKSKSVKISLAVDAYTIATFICIILCSAYTTLLQKVTRYACDYRTVDSIKIQWMDITYSFPFWCGRCGRAEVMTSARPCTGTFLLIVLIHTKQCLLPALKGEGRFASILIGCAKTDGPITGNITGSFRIVVVANPAWPSYHRIARLISNKVMFCDCRQYMTLQQSGTDKQCNEGLSCSNTIQSDAASRQTISSSHILYNVLVPSTEISSRTYSEFVRKNKVSNHITTQTHLCIP